MVLGVLWWAVRSSDAGEMGGLYPLSKLQIPHSDLCGFVFIVCFPILHEIVGWRERDEPDLTGLALPFHNG
jgi:hypothetical protein